MNELADRLGEAGFAVGVERFRGRASAEPWLASYAGVSALAALLVYPIPFAATLLGIAAVVLHARESDGRPLLRAGSREVTNLVARAPAAASPRVIVVADVGAPHRGTPRAVRLSLQTLMAAVPAAGAAAWVAEAETELPRSMVTGGVVAAVAIVALVLVAHRPPGDEAPGSNPALDVLFALAPLLREHNVWLVAAGAGAESIRALVDAHTNGVAGAAWLNLAPSPSAGSVVAASEEGTWRERRADRWLLDVAEEAGAEVRTHRAATLVTPLLAGRRRALTLLVGGGPDDVRTVAGTVLAATASSR